MNSLSTMIGALENVIEGRYEADGPMTVVHVEASKIMKNEITKEVQITEWAVGSSEELY